MGLSGRKQKQRIGPDPRNLSWADDASKFGTSYLSKFGWDASQGLGASGDGRTSHIKVQQKLDMMGIGAQHQKDPNGIAWKQNKDFENVLMRLNASMGGGDPDALEDEDRTALGGAFISATEETKDGKVDKKEKKDKKKDKKRKRSGDDSDEEETKKKVKTDDAPLNSVVAVSETVVAVQKVKVVPRHRAHRARAIAAKNRAGNSSAAMSEILGISSQSTTPTPGTCTPITKLDEPPTMEKLTVSTKSVADYFKERLLAKANGKTSMPSATPSRTDEDEAPSGGIGSSRSAFRLSSRFSDDEDAPQPMGLGMSKFGSLMSSAFLAATISVGLSAPKSDPESVEEITGGEEKKKRKRKDHEVEDEEIVAKKRRKEEKRAKKEREREELKVEESKLSKEERKKLKSERKAEKKKRNEEL